MEVYQPSRIYSFLQKLQDEKHWDVFILADTENLPTNKTFPLHRLLNRPEHKDFIDILKDPSFNRFEMNSFIETIPLNETCFKEIDIYFIHTQTYYNEFQFARYAIEKLQKYKGNRNLTFYVLNQSWLNTESTIFFFKVFLESPIQ